MTASRVRLGLVGLGAVGLGTLGLGAVLAGCGVPTGGPAETIPASEVPFGLTSPSAQTSATPAPEPQADPTRVYLVARDDSLVPRPREVTGRLAQDRLDSLLAALAAGPTAAEHDLQLSTALPPDVELTVTDLTGGTATIDLAGPTDAPAGPAGRRAVAQLVLSATSVPGVDAVVLTVDGAPVDAPLPSGQLSPAPLSADDYVTYLTPPPPVTPAPGPGPAPPS
ncbi:GerMN domain-containing protein [Geodermatophilus sabuli]|uniref:Sporulation and spore germination n=1 Tax=Geodermatophilus sabuli TaxID=1564158 RepID=A0A285EIU6_9ACTN|nr:GerMN domain-containing protein [Geodermatophilus sabuli]MBB3086853.1 spore germination protein GerM [Geodermatophilus sabuli]SNX98773.1 Sporulation and spore germination [Geodermatophilus sabuli]